MGTITVRQLIEFLNKSLEDGSIRNDSAVLYGHFTDQLSGCECYNFNVDFLWGTLEED